jgi:hypothetical protein
MIASLTQPTFIYETFFFSWKFGETHFLIGIRPQLSCLLLMASMQIKRLTDIGTVIIVPSHLKDPDALQLSRDNLVIDRYRSKYTTRLSGH